MSPPLVSCIVPVYNGKRYLGEALDSILCQTHAVIELIVVDDGSTDGTSGVLAPYGDRITSLRRENAGTPSARNAGLACSRGEYVAFLDADDRWHPEKLARQLERFRIRPDLQVSFTMIQSYWSEDVPESHRVADEFLIRPVPGYVCPTLVARREAFDAVGPFDASLAHASEMAWILAAAERGLWMEMLPDVLVHRRLHSANVSTRKAGDSHREYLGLLKAWIDRGRRGGTPLAHDFGAFASGAGTRRDRKPERI